MQIRKAWVVAAKNTEMSSTFLTGWFEWYARVSQAYRDRGEWTVFHSLRWMPSWVRMPSWNWTGVVTISSIYS